MSPYAFGTEPAESCLQPLALAARLGELRTQAAPVSDHRRVVGSQFFQSGHIFRDPIIERLLLDTVGEVSRLREAANVWREFPGTNESFMTSNEDMRPRYRDIFNTFLNLFAEWKGYYATEPPLLVQDSGRREFIYALNQTNEVTTLLFLSKLRTAFPESRREPQADPKLSLDQLYATNETLKKLRLTPEEYYALAPKVYRLFDQLKKWGETSHEEQQALVRILSELFEPLAKRVKAQETYAEAEAELRKRTREFDETEKRSSVWGRDLFSSYEKRRNEALKQWEESAQEYRGPYEEADATLRTLYDSLTLIPDVTSTTNAGTALTVNPELTAKANALLTHDPIPPDPALSPRFEAARREIAELDVARLRYFSDSGLFGLKEITERKGRATADFYIERMRKRLTPPNLGDTVTTSFHAQDTVAQWQSYLKSVGVSEAQYFQLVKDLHELESNQTLRDRVLGRLLPEWENDFKELETLRELAYGKIEPETPVAKALMAAGALVPSEVPSPLTIGRTQEAVGIYLDTTNVWTQEFNSVVKNATEGRYAELAAEAGSIAAEAGKLQRKGQPIDARVISARLLPKITAVAKELDDELPRLARLHSEGLMIQAGLNNHVKLLRDLAIAKRQTVIANAESLPDWQQDVALRQLERGETRLSAIDKVKLSFDRSVERSTAVEQSIERMREQVIDLNLFLHGHLGDTAPMKKDQVDLLLKLLKGYEPAK